MNEEEEHKKVVDLTFDDIGGAMFEGERIDITEILDENIVIERMDIKPSMFYDGEYAIVQIEKDGDKFVVLTSSSVLIQQITNIKDRLPMRCRIIKKVSPTKKQRYYTIVPPED